MNHTASFSTALFAETSQAKSLTDFLGEDIHGGMAGPVEFGLSKSRAKKSSSSRAAAAKAKLNTMIYAVDLLIDGGVNAITLQGNTLYTEYNVGDSGTPEVISATFDGTTISFYNGIPSKKRDFTVPMALYAISEISPFTETKEIFANLCSAINDPGGSMWKAKEELFRLCDAYYYEGSTLLPSEIAMNNDLLIETVQECIRTNAADAISALQADPGNFPHVFPFTRIEFTANTDGSEEKSGSKVPTTSTFERAKSGEFILNTYWDASRRVYIPKLESLKDFVPIPAYYTMLSLLSHELGIVNARLEDGLFGSEAIGNEYINVQFVGRPGTGKSTLASALAATLGMPIRIVPISKHTEEDAFTGMTKVQEGGFTFVETPFLDAYKNGGIIVLEEFNLGDPGVLMGALGQAIEKPFILLEDGYREVHRHPLCVIIATMNTGTQGSREPSEALTSRMADIFTLPDPKDEDFINILVKQTGAKKNDAKRVHDIYKKVLAYLTSPTVNEENIALSITLRSCIRALRQMAVGVSFKDAITNTIIGAISQRDMNLADEVKMACVDTSRGK